MTAAIGRKIEANVAGTAAGAILTQGTGSQEVGR